MSNTMDPKSTAEELEKVEYSEMEKKQSLHDLWDEWYKRLLEFKAIYGHCIVPRSYNSYKDDTRFSKTLGVWVDHQRFNKSKDTLSADRIAKLDAIGFTWVVLGNLKSIPNRQITQFEVFYKGLQSYHKRHGHIHITKDDPEQVLYRWVEDLRKNPKFLNQKKVKALNEIGFPWSGSGHRNDWDLMYIELLKYKSSHGNCNVPPKYAPDPFLATWVRRQHNLDPQKYPQRKRMLDSIDFPWGANLKEDGKETHQTAKQCHNHLSIALREKENPKKNENSDVIMPSWDAEAVWDPSILWDRWYQRLLEYREIYGDCLVPQNFNSYKDKTKYSKTLGSWVAQQRLAKRKGRLKEDRIQKLNAIDFEWNVNLKSKRSMNLQRWNAAFERLKLYKAKHGNFDVKKNDPDQQLYIFVQNLIHNRDAIYPSKIKSLCDIGFKWDSGGGLQKPRFPTNNSMTNEVQNNCRQQPKKPTPKATDKPQNHQRKHACTNVLWNRWYKALLEYKTKYGDCLVPKLYNSYKDDTKFSKSLGGWVGQQRSLMKKGKLREDRKMLLDQIGFSWSVDSEQTRGNSMKHWLVQYERLKEYYVKHGHFEVAENDPDKELYAFVKRTKNDKDFSISAAKINLLTKIGFTWNEADDNCKEEEPKQKKIKLGNTIHSGNCQIPQGPLPDQLLQKRFQIQMNQIPQMLFAGNGPLPFQPPTRQAEKNAPIQWKQKSQMFGLQIQGNRNYPIAPAINCPLPSEHSKPPTRKVEKRPKSYTFTNTKKKKTKLKYNTNNGNCKEPEGPTPEQFLKGWLHIIRNNNSKMLSANNCSSPSEHSKPPTRKVEKRPKSYTFTNTKKKKTKLKYNTNNGNCKEPEGPTPEQFLKGWLHIIRNNNSKMLSANNCSSPSEQSEPPTIQVKPEEKESQTFPNTTEEPVCEEFFDVVPTESDNWV